MDVGLMASCASVRIFVSKRFFEHNLAVFLTINFCASICASDAILTEWFSCSYRRRSLRPKLNAFALRAIIMVFCGISVFLNASHEAYYSGKGERFLFHSFYIAVYPRTLPVYAFFISPTFQKAYRIEAEPALQSAVMLQYSLLKCLSRSRSTISLTATDCTLPALSPRLTLRYKSGDNL
jgi:hypothetical protein